MAGLADWCQVPLFVHVILREQPNTKEDYSTLAALLFSEDFCGKWDYYHPSQPVTPVRASPPTRGR